MSYLEAPWEMLSKKANKILQDEECVEEEDYLYCEGDDWAYYESGDDWAYAEWGDNWSWG